MLFALIQRHRHLEQILRNIEGRELDETQDPSKTQRRLIERDAIQRLDKENGHIINRAFQHRTIQTWLILYEQLNSSGIMMEIAVPWFNQANLSRRLTGVWELTMDGSYDDGNFIVVREFGQKDAYFNLTGFSVFGPNVALSDDDQIGTQDWYGPECTIKVIAGDKTFNYGCDAYLSRQSIDQIVRDMRGALNDANVKKEKPHTADLDV